MAQRRSLARGCGVGVAAAGVVASALGVAGPAQAAQPAPKVGATSAYLLDAESGKKLWGQGDSSAREMASTTKVMTATVAVDTAGALDKTVTVKQEYRDYVQREGASQADLKTGDKLTVRQLLPAMLLPSGCDAAYAIADKLGSGDTVQERVSSFIGKMNTKADELGLQNTEFDSFDGISQGGDNKTTAGDLAKLTRHAMENSTFAATVKKTTAEEEATNGRQYTWYNTNKLLGSYAGAVGVKTGTGTAAGPCLVFAAERDGRTVIGVVLNSTSGDARYTDAKNMLDYAYGSESTLKLRTLPKGAEQD